MFTGEYVFSPRKTTPKAREKLADAVEGLIIDFAKNGQTYGDAVMTWIGSKLHVTCYMPRPNSLSAECMSEWGKRDYDKLLPLLVEAPSYRVLDDGPFPRKYSEWQTAKILYLFTHFLDITSPVCAWIDGAAIPLYTLPLTASQKETIFFWQQEYKATDLLWIGSGELEIAVYRELADPQSGLARRGCRICQEIERATQTPTYYYLMRYWGRRKTEAERLCPGCGKPWATFSAHERFFDFEFRCDLCRLVANLAVSFEDERHARIGEYSRRPRKSQS